MMTAFRQYLTQDAKQIYRCKKCGDKIELHESIEYTEIQVKMMLAGHVCSRKA